MTTADGKYQLPTRFGKMVKAADKRGHGNGGGAGGSAPAALWADDQFVLASDGAQDLTLTYLPIDTSTDVSLNGLRQRRGVDYTVERSTVHLLSAAAALTGWVLEVHYQYDSDEPAYVAPSVDPVPFFDDYNRTDRALDGDNGWDALTGAGFAIGGFVGPDQKAYLTGAHPGGYNAVGHALLVQPVAGGTHFEVSCYLDAVGSTGFAGEGVVWALVDEDNYWFAYLTGGGFGGPIHVGYVSGGSLTELSAAGSFPCGTIDVDHDLVTGALTITHQGSPVYTGTHTSLLTAGAVGIMSLENYVGIAGNEWAVWNDFTAMTS